MDDRLTTSGSASWPVPTRMPMALGQRSQAIGARGSGV
jgi:hypothetical protein